MRRPFEASTSAMDARRELGDDFSGVVFKVQAGMDKNHRDTLAFMRVVSGEFDRGCRSRTPSPAGVFPRSTP